MHQSASHVASSLFSSGYVRGHQFTVLTLFLCPRKTLTSGLGDGKLDFVIER